MSAEPAVIARVSRRFAAAPAQLFDAWLDPERIGRFMFGPLLRDEEVVRISLDATVGGRFSFVVRRQDQEIDHVGTYLAIERPRHLAFTWGVASEGGDTSRVSIDVAPHDFGCELTLQHELAPAWAEYRERCEAGWAKMLDALATIEGL